MTKLFVLALVGIASASVAQARPSTYKMTCAQAQALVEENGAIVMNYGYSPKAGYLYERFVTDANKCDAGYRSVESFRAQTLDNDRCDVGYICAQHDSHN